jgi:hypothetical protein
MKKTKGFGNGKYLKEGIKSELMKKQKKNIKNLKKWEFKIEIEKIEYVIKGNGQEFEIKNIDELVLFFILTKYINEGLNTYLDKAIDKVIEEGGV